MVKRFVGQRLLYVEQGPTGGGRITTRHKEHTRSSLCRSVVNIRVCLGVWGLPGSHVCQHGCPSMCLTGAGATCAARQQSPICSSILELPSTVGGRVAVLRPACCCESTIVPLEKGGGGTPIHTNMVINTETQITINLSGICEAEPPRPPPTKKLPHSSM